MEELAHNPEGDDIYYQNQKLFCKTNNLPLFANKTCSHGYRWMQGNPQYNKSQTLGEMLVAKYGSEKAFIVSSSELITGCPSCGRTWCD